MKKKEKIKKECIPYHNGDKHGEPEPWGLDWQAWIASMYDRGGVLKECPICGKKKFWVRRK